MLYREGHARVEAGVPLASIRALPCVPLVMRAKSAHGNDEMEALEALQRRVRQELAGLAKPPEAAP